MTLGCLTSRAVKTRTWVFKNPQLPPLFQGARNLDRPEQYSLNTILSVRQLGANSEQPFLGTASGFLDKRDPKIVSVIILFPQSVAKCFPRFARTPRRAARAAGADCRGSRSSGSPGLERTKPTGRLVGRPVGRPTSLLHVWGLSSCKPLGAISFGLGNG